jgi:hypothetical protein
MQTAPGHYYKLDLVLSGPLVTSSDWVAEPLAEKYHVDVVSLAKPQTKDDGWPHTTAVVRWKSAPGAITEGDTLESRADVLSPIPVGATAIVVAIVDLGLSMTVPYEALPNYLLAAVILLGTLLLVRRIP